MIKAKVGDLLVYRDSRNDELWLVVDVRPDYFSRPGVGVRCLLSHNEKHGEYLYVNVDRIHDKKYLLRDILYIWHTF